MFRRLAAAALLLLVAAALSNSLAAQQAPVPDPRPGPAAPALLTIGTALRSALTRNPDFLNSSDALLSAQWNERAVRSTFLPQVVPFFSAEKSDETGERTDSYGLLVSEQFLFGTALTGQAIVNRQPFSTGGESHTADYRLTLSQPLLRGVDPAVSAEPLRLAKRFTSTQSRALEVARRRTVLLIYQTYLGVSRQEEAVRIAVDRVERSRELTAFSRARFSAGSVSRLDVLRAEQQEASTVVAMNDAQNALDDLRDSLRRTAGLLENQPFSIEMPRELPVSELQAEVARLRFEKGLSDNFNVVDADNLLNTARLFELDSRVSILLARLDCLYSSGQLDVKPFLDLP